MSDLRTDVALAIAEQGGPLVAVVQTSNDLRPAEQVEADRCLAAADAVLRVVGDALMGDEAVQAAWGEIHGDAVVIHDTVVCALSAAWRVVTGSNA